MKCPKCNSENVEMIEHDYDSPEADELGYYEYKCKNCGYIWEVEFEFRVRLHASNRELTYISVLANSK